MKKSGFLLHKIWPGKRRLGSCLTTFVSLKLSAVAKPEIGCMSQAGKNASKRLGHLDATDQIAVDPTKAIQFSFARQQT